MRRRLLPGAPGVPRAAPGARKSAVEPAHKSAHKAGHELALKPTTPSSCFAIATPGFEPVVAAELRALGFNDAAIEQGGVAFSADSGGVFIANLQLRSATRVLVRVAEFTAKSFAELERRAKPVAWKSYVKSDARAEFRVTCKKSRLYHSDAVAERLTRSLVTAVPGVEVGRAAKDDGEDDSDGAPKPASQPASRSQQAAPSQLFVVRFLHDVCTISADASGELLHRRGYRLATAKAPIRENIAAGCLLALGYDGTQPLIDPMCGSGTFAIEAALIARKIPPGINRRFACELWPGFDAPGAERARAGARSGITSSAPAPIHASDRDAGAIEATIANATRAGVVADLVVGKIALSGIESAGAHGILVANPPYGARVGERDPLRNLYAQLGNVARGNLPGWRVALVSAERALEAQTKLPFEELVRFSNGGIKVRLIATR